MNVWIDGLAFESDRQRGVWRVFYELINRTKDRVNYTIWLQQAPAQPLPKGVKIVRTEGRGELGAGEIRKRLSRRWLRTHDPHEMAEADIFHSTGFTWPKRDSLPAVVTLCDMIAESHFAVCTREVQESLPIKHQALQRAAALACISESTRKELVAFYPEYEQKAYLLPLSVSPLDAELPTNSTSVASPVGDLSAPCKSNGTESIRTEGDRSALYVGQRAGYKNFNLVLSAMTSNTWPPTTSLKVVGGAFNYGELLLIRRYGLQDRIEHLGVLDDPALMRQYRRAHCLIFPSLQEGFGLPCLEAQTARCPLVCSNIPVFHEVAGEGAIFFDPQSPESLASAVRSLLLPALRDGVTIAGEHNLSRFDWDSTANKLLAIYERLVKTR